jgi:hypothetical protein
MSEAIDLLWCSGGHFKPTSDFNKWNNPKRDRGYQTLCRDCQHEYGRVWRSTDTGKKSQKAFNHSPTGKAVQRAYYNTPKGALKHFKNRAKFRGIEFALTLEDILAHWQEPCSYCGRAIKNCQLDRVDNNKGYLPGNIVSCCKYCNNSKHDRPVEEFLTSDWLKQRREKIHNKQ